MRKKNWRAVIVGIVLIILSIYIFNNPETVLAGISFWFGILVLAAGLVGIVDWLVSDKAERESMSLLWSILTFVFGLLMVTNVLATMKALTIIFGLWCLLSGLFLLTTGWSLKKINSIGWVMVIVGLFCVVAAVMMIMDIGSGAIAISTLLGLQTLLTGIALVLSSFAKKIIVGNIREAIK